MQKYMEKKYLKVDEEKLQREFSSQFCAQKKFPNFIRRANPVQEL